MLICNLDGYFLAYIYIRIQSGGISNAAITHNAEY